MQSCEEQVIFEQELHCARANIYKFLYLLFAEEMTVEQFLEIKEKGNIQDLKNIGHGGELLFNFFQNSTKDQLIYEVEEFRRLFLGPGPMPAPPWESVYRSKENLLFDVSTIELRKQYKKFGLKFVNENKEPEDHLLLELEFLIYLIEQYLTNNKNSGEVYIDAQIHLLQNHFIKWIPAFTTRLMNGTKSKLYQGAAMLLNEFISFDLESLKEEKEVS